MNPATNPFAPGAGSPPVWSPSYGDTAFSVPLFDQFMHRIMPSDEWQTDT